MANGTETVGLLDVDGAFLRITAGMEGATQGDEAGHQEVDRQAMYAAVGRRAVGSTGPEQPVNRFGS